MQDTANKAMPTARIRLDAHNTDPVCAGCHKITDPIGLSLERFDGIGAARASENEAAIDSSGMMDGVSFQGAAGLGKAIAASPDATMCVSSRALEYAMGRSPEGVSPLVEKLEADFAAGGYRIRDLFLRVATMPEAWAVETAPVDTGKVHISMTQR